MRILNEKLLNAGDMSGNLSSSPLNLDFAFGYAIQCVSTGAPVGTVKLQGSNDASLDANPNLVNFAPATWTDISGATASISAAGSVLFNSANAYYRWVRAVYTFTSGTGALTITGNTKGF